MLRRGDTLFNSIVSSPKGRWPSLRAPATLIAFVVAGLIATGASRTPGLPEPQQKGIATLDGSDGGKTIEGRVFGPLAADTSKAREGSAVIDLVPLDTGESPVQPLLTLTTSLAPPVDGDFEIDNVPQGRYNLIATIRDSRTGDVAVGRLSISIEGFELPTVRIVTHPGVAVAGRVTRGNRPYATGVAVMLEPDRTDAGVSVYQDVAKLRPTVAADGSFKFDKVPEGRYRLRATVNGETAPIALLQDGKKIPDAALTVGDTAPAPVEIAIEN